MSLHTIEELSEALLEARREVESLRLQRSHATTLLDAIGSLLTSTLDDDPFDVLFRALSMAFSFSAFMVLAEDEEGGHLTCIAARPPAGRRAVFPVDRFFRKILDGRVSTTLGTAAPGDGGQPAGLVGQPGLYLPMRVRQRRGILVLLRAPGSEGFSRSDVALAKRFSVLASAAFAALYTRQRELESRRLRQLTEQLRRSERALAQRAYFDQLTGLPNRETVEERVTGAIAGLPEGQGLALAFIDLDDFKKVNDYHNHAVGDALLLAVAERVKAMVRTGDVLGRISGDEFVLLLRSPGDRRQTAQIVERILDRLRRPFRIEGLEIYISASIGVSLFPDHGRDYETLRRNADLAMYRAKKSAKGSAFFFDESIGAATTARMRIEQQLRGALRQRQFRCAYQPKVDIGAGRVVGFEALVRWIDRDGTVHAPSTFLPVAEELGLANDIADLVLADILDAFGQLEPRFGQSFSISMNIAPRQASNLRYMQGLVEAILASGRARRFMLEITEEAVVQRDPFQSEIVPLLRQHGIGISIDDFGMGYSSFSVLADITADELKVDRTFVTAIHERPRSQGILKAVDSLGAALGMRVVAEGVETADELAYLRRHTGIALMQGYHFCRPLLPEELATAELPLPRPAGLRATA